MNQERLLKVILSPYMANKVNCDNTSCMAFKVARTASKLEIKTAVEALFEVQVDSVRVLNVKGHQRRFKKTLGMTKTWKKAYVKLQGNYNINFDNGN